MCKYQKEFEKECALCTDAYKERYHCPLNNNIDSLLVTIACQVEHAHRRKERNIF